MSKPFFKLRPLSSVSLRRLYGMAAGALVPGLALAGPTGGNVVAGQATIGTPSAGNTVINQTSQNAVINWQQFSVNGNEFVLFNQPNASAAVLNRVVGGLPSEILGNLSANGRVFIINPQGVMFGAGSRVDVNGLVASTMNIKDQDFMSGRHVFAQGTAAPGTVRNEGRISAGPNGFVVLAGDRVENAGIINANGGDVLLASGSRMTLTLDAEGLVGYSIDAAALSDRAGVENLGEIVANGGAVVLDAKVARSLIGNVINNKGKITARSVEERDGEIYLLAEGGNVENSGTLDASGTGNADGGKVIVRSDRDITLTETGVIRADGAGTGDGGIVRLIAEENAVTERGSVISATAGPAGRLGGFIELSGHGSLRVRGEVRAGRGGQVLIDPTIVRIAQGNFSATGSGSSATIYEQQIESMLNAGTDVAIVASGRIIVNDLSSGGDGELNATGSGDLLLGISTISPASSHGAVGVQPSFGGFNRGGGGSSYGGILFNNLGNAIRVNGRLKLLAGTAQGNISVGDLEASDIEISGDADIDVGNITLVGSGGNVDIRNTAGAAFGSSEDVTIGSITALGANQVILESRNTLTLTGLSDMGSAEFIATAGATGFGGNLNINGNISAGRVQLEATQGNISARDINANGTASGTSFSTADVAIRAVVNGSVSVDNVSLSGDGGLLLEGPDGVNINGVTINVGTGGTALVTGGDVGGTFGGTINLGSSDGSLNVTGNLQVTANGNVDVNAGSGGLTVSGNLDIDVNSGGALTLDDVTADRVKLSTEDGDISVGLITATTSFGGGSASNGVIDVRAVGTAQITQVGGVVLSNADGYVVLSGQNGIGGLGSGGSFVVGTSGTLDLRALSANLDLGNSLQVDGNLIGDGLSISGTNLTVTDGDLTLTAFGGISFGTSGSGSISVAGVASLSAGGGSTGGISLNSLSAGQITLFTPNGQISAVSLTADGGFRGSGDVNIDAQGSSGQVAIGSIQLNSSGRVDIDGANGVAVIGGIDAMNGSINLRADGGTIQFGDSAGSPVNFSGDLDVDANNGATIQGLQPVVVTDGNVNMTGSGSTISGSPATISLEDGLSALDGRIELDATGSISVSSLAALNSIQVTSTGSSSSVSVGSVTLSSAGSAQLEGNRVNIDTSADVQTGGTLRLSAGAGGVHIGTDGSSAAVTINGNLEAYGTASGDVDAVRDIVVTNGNVIITAEGDVSLNALDASDGFVRINGDADISLGDIVAAGGFGFSNGVHINANGANPLSGLGTITLRSAGTVELYGENGVTVQQHIDAGGTSTNLGTITVSASAGSIVAGNSDISFNFNGNLFVYADTGANFSADIDSGTGNVEVQMRAFGVGLGSFNADRITVAGNITLGNTFGQGTGSGGGVFVPADIVVGNIESTTGGIFITSTRNVTATSSAASAGITAAGLVDIDAGVDVSTGGTTGDVILPDVTGSRVLIGADGDLLLQNVTATASGASNDVHLVSEAGEISVQGIVLSGGPNSQARLEADSGINLGSGSFDMGTNGDLHLTVNNGDMEFGGSNLTVTGNIIATGVNVTGSGSLTATGGIQIYTGGNIDFTGFVSANTGLLDISGSGGAGDISLAGVYGDHVRIFNDGNITLNGTVNSGGGGGIAGGGSGDRDIDIQSTAGTVTVGGIGTAGDGYAVVQGVDINLTPGGLFAVGYGGELFLDATGDISFGTGPLDTVQVTGKLRAVADGTITGNRIITGGNSSAVTGDLELFADQITINAGGLLQANSGEVYLNAGSDGAGTLSVGDVRGETIYITNHGGVTTGDLTANGGGSSGAKDIYVEARDDSSGLPNATVSVGTIDMILATGGYAELYAHNDVTLTGGADVGAAGALKISSDKGAVNLGDILQGGDLHVTTGGTGFGGSIIGGDIIATTIFLFNNYSGATDITVSSLDATGNIDVTARNNLTAPGSIASTTGVVQLTAGQDGSGAVDVQDVSGDRVILFTNGNISTGLLSALGGGSSAGNADVKVEAQSGSVQVGGVALTGSSGFAYLQGDGGIDVTGPSFDVMGGTLQLQTTSTIDFGTGTGDAFVLDGNLLVSGGGIVGNSITTTGGGDIDFTVPGGISIGALNAGGDLDIYAPGGITLTQAATAGGGITLQAVNANVGISFVDLTATDGSVSLTAARGNISGQNITAGGDITVSARRDGGQGTNGALSGDITLNDVTVSAAATSGGVQLGAADQVTVNAVTAGSNGLLDIDTGALIATGALTAGSVDVDVGSANLGGGATALAGDVDVLTSGALDAGATSTISATGDIRLQSTGSTVTANVLDGANVTVTGASGVTLSGDIDIVGDISLTAINANTGISFTNLTTVGGSVTLTAARGDVSGSDITAGAAITVSARRDGGQGTNGALSGDISIGDLVAGNTVGTSDITLFAADAIGVASLGTAPGGVVDIDTGTLTTGAITAGSVDIDVGTANLNGNITSTTSNIDVSTTGNIIAGAATTLGAAGDVILNAGGSVTANVLDGDNVAVTANTGIDLNGDIDIVGNINLSTSNANTGISFTNLTTTGGSITLTAARGDVSGSDITAGAAITVNARRDGGQGTNGALSGDISVGDLVAGTTAGSSDIILFAADGIGVASLGTAPGGVVDIDTGTLTTGAITAGSVDIDVGTANLNGNVTSTTSNIDVRTTGNIVAGATTTLAAAGDVILDAGGSVTANVLDGDNVTVTANTGIDLNGDIDITGDIDLYVRNANTGISFVNLTTTGGSVTLTAERGDVAGQDISAGNNITVSARRDGGQGTSGGLSGNIDLQDLTAGTAVPAGGVTLTAADQVTVTSIQTGAAGLVDINTGSLTTNGTVTGASIDIDVTTAQFNGDVTATNGDVDVLTGGALAAAAATTIGATGDIRLQSTGNAVTAHILDGDNITVTAVAGVTLTGDMDVTGDISLTNSNANIGISFTNLTTTGGSVTLTAARGDVKTSAIGDITAGGAITVSARRDGGQGTSGGFSGDIDVGNLSSGNLGAGGITLNAADRIDAGTLTANSGGAVELDAGGAGITTTGGISGGIVDVNTSGTFVLGGNVTADDYISLIAGGAMNLAGRSITAGSDDASDGVTLQAGSIDLSNATLSGAGGFSANGGNADGITFFNTVLDFGGQLSFTDSSGDFDLGNSVFSGGSIYLRANGGNLVTDDLTATAGYVDLGAAGAVTTGLLNAADGYVSVDAGGQIAINGLISATQQVSLEAGSGILVTGNISGAPGAGEAIDIHSDTGTISVQDVTTTGGSIRIGNQFGANATDITTQDLSAVNGGVDVIGSGNVSVQTVASETGLRLRATGGTLTLVGDLSADSGSADVYAGTGPLVLGDVSASGTITLGTGSGSLTANDVSTSADADIDVAGDLTLASLSADTGLDIDAGGQLTVNGAISSISGQFSLDAGSGVLVTGNISGAGSNADTIDIHTDTGTIGLQDVTATAGSIRIGNQFGDNATDITTQDLSAASGSVDVIGSGNVDVQTVTTEAGLRLRAAGGTLTLMGNLAVDSGNAEVYAGTGPLALGDVSASGTITLGTGSGSLTANDVSTSANADIDVAGDLTLASLSADTGIDVDVGGLLTVNGAISNINGLFGLDAGTGILVMGSISGAGIGTDIIDIHTDTGTIDLQAVTATAGSIRIGNQFGDSATDVTALALTALGGGIQVSGDGLVDLPNVTAGNGVILAAGTTLDVLDVEAGTGSVSLSSGNDLNAGNVTAQGVGTIQSSAGDVTLASLSADGGIDVDAGGLLTVNGAIDNISGQFTLDAGTGILVTGNISGAGIGTDIIDIHTDTGTIGLQDVTATAGSIRIGNQFGDNATDITTQDLSAVNGGVDVIGSGDVSVQTVAAETGLRLRATGGTLTLVGNLAVDSGNAELYAGTGPLLLGDVSAGGTITLGTGSGNLTANNVSTSANTDIDVAGDLTLASLSADTGIDVDVGGQLTVNGAVSNINGLFGLDAGTGILVTGSISGAGIGTDIIDIHTVTGTIDLQDVTATAGSIRIGNQFGGGATDVTALALSALGGNIQVSGIGLVDLADVTAGNGVTVNAGTTLDVLDVGAGAGSVNLGSGNDLNAGNVTAQGVATIQSTTGDVTLASLSADGGIEIDAGGLLTVNGAIDNINGLFSVDAGTGVLVTGSISGAGIVTDIIDIHTDTGTIDLQDVTATGGSIRIGNQFGDNATQLDIGTVSAVGSVDLDINGPINLGGPITGGSAIITAGLLSNASLVDVSTTTGSIVINANVQAPVIDLDAAASLTVSGSVDAGASGSVTLIARNGAASTGTITTSDLTFQADDVTFGDINLTGDLSITSNAGNVVTGQIDAANVTIDSAADLTSDGIDSPGAVSLTAVDIMLGGAVSGASVVINADDVSGTVDITATAGTLDLNVDVVTSSLIDLDGLDGIDVTGQLDATGGSVVLNSGNGLILIGGGIIAANVQATAVSLDVADLFASSNASLSGDVILTATGGDIIGGNVSGSSLSLTASGLVDTGDLTATGGAITINGTGIDAGVIDASGNVTLTAAGGSIFATSIDGAIITLTALSGDLVTDGITGTGTVTADAGAIFLGGAVQGTSVDLDAATDLLAVDLLDISATAGLLRLEGTTIGGINGADLDATGTLTLVGTLDGGSGPVNLDGSVINTNAISTTGSVTAMATTGNLITGAIGGGAITLTANSGTLRTAAITGTGAVTADANAIVLTGAVQGAQVDLDSATTLTRSGGLLDVSATSGLLRLEGTTISGGGADLDATGTLTLVGTLNGGSGAITLDGSAITTDALSTTGNVTATATTGGLSIGTINGRAITLTANGGVLSTGAITGTNAVTADANAIALGGAVQGTTVDLDAATTLSASGLLDASATTGLLRLEGTTISGASGADLDAATTLTLVGALNGGTGPVTLDGTAISANAITTTGNVTAAATTGNLTTGPIGGDAITLTANGGTLSTGAISGTGAVTADARTISLGGTVSGDGVDLDAATTLTVVGALNGGSGPVILDGTAIGANDITTTGDVTAIAGTGNLNTGNVGGNIITLTANAGTLNAGAITGSGAVTADANAIVLGGAVQGTTVDLDAATSLSATGLLDVSATAGLVRLEGTTISGATGADLDATDTLTLVGDLIGGSGPVTLDGTVISANAINTTGNVSATASAGDLTTGSIGGNAITLTANSGTLDTGAITGTGAVIADASAIVLGGPVSGASVDLDAATTLSAGGLLDVLATAGGLSLEGSSISGSGASLTATGAITVVGSLSGGSGTVSIVGGSIDADAISTSGVVTATANAAGGNLTTDSVGGSDITLTANGTLDINGTANATGDLVLLGQAILVQDLLGDTVFADAAGSLTVNGAVTAGNGASLHGDTGITVTGLIDAGAGDAHIGANGGGSGAINVTGGVTAQSIEIGDLYGGATSGINTGALDAVSTVDIVTGGSSNVTVNGGIDAGSGITLAVGGVLTIIGDTNGNGSFVEINAGSITADNLSGDYLKLTSTGLIDTDNLTAAAGGIQLTGGGIDVGAVSISAGGDLVATASSGALTIGGIGADVVTLTANNGTLTTGGAIVASGAVTADANKIVLGGAVSGAGVDLDSATTLSTTGLLSISGGTGPVVLEGTSISGNGITATTSGSVTLVGSANGGSGAVTLGGSTITANAISGGSLQLTGTGLVDTDNLTATGGAIIVTAGSVDAGAVSASGNVTATASSGNLTTGSIGGGTINLTANGGTLSTGAITGTGAVTADANAISLAGAVQGTVVDLDAVTTLSATGLLDVSATSGLVRLEGTSISGNGADIDTATTLTLVGALNAGSGPVNLDGTVIATNAISTTGNVTAAATTGNLVTGTIGGNTISLTANNGTLRTGAITGTGAVTAVANVIVLSGPVQGSTVDLDAATTLSTQGGGLLDVSATGGLMRLEGTTIGGGGADLDATGTLTLVGALNGGSGVVTLDGAAIAANAISTTGNVTATASTGNLTTGAIGGRAITLTANGGTLSTGAITGSNAVTADANAIVLGGAVQGTRVDLDAATTLSATGLLDVSANAGLLRLEATTISGGGADLDATGTLTLVGELNAGSGIADLSGASLSTNKVGAGTLILNGTGSVSTGDLVATVGTITVDGGSIEVDNVTVPGGFTATASSGDLSTGRINAGGVNLTGFDGVLSTGQIISTDVVNGHANQIVLGGSVSGTAVDLGAFTTISSTSLLDISATSGDLFLHASSVSGNGVDLSSTALVLLYAPLDGGAGLVNVVGNTIQMDDDVSGERVQLSAAGSVHTFNINSGAGGISINGDQVRVDDLVATTGGDITATALGGYIATGLVSGDVVRLTANSDIYTTNIIANRLDLTAGEIISTLALQIGSGGAVLEGGSIDTGAITVAGGDLEVTANTGDLVVTGAISANEVTLTATLGDIDVDDVTATDAHFTAPVGSITVGAVNASGDVDFDFGTDLNTGTLTLDGTLFADLQDTDAVFGNVNAQAVDITVDGGNIVIGNVDVDEDINLDASGSVSFGNLDGRNIAIAMGEDSSFTSSLVNASGSFELGGSGVLSGNSLRVNAASIDIQSGLTLDSATLDADTSLTLGPVAFNIENLVASASTIMLDGSVVHGSAADLTATGSLTLEGADLLVDDIGLSAGGNLVVNDTHLQGSLVAEAGDNASFTDVTMLSGSGQVDADNIVITRSSVNYSGLRLTAGQGEVQVINGTVVVSGNLGFQAQGDIDLSHSSLQVAGNATLAGLGDIGLVSSEFSGGRYTIQAGGSVQDAGEGGSSFNVSALGISAGTSIELGNSSFEIGNGVAAIGGDDGLIEALSGVNPELLPQSQGPNASFIAHRVELGSLDLAGDYLYISSDEVVLGGSISAPLDLFVHFSPMTADAELGIEAAASLARQINLNRDEHFNVFPGTTFAIGGANYLGDIYIGQDGGISFGTRETNFVFMTQGSIFGLSSLGTNGSVVVLDGLVDSSGDFEMPLNSEFMPDLPNDDLELDEPSSEEADFGAGEIEYESAPEVDESLQCA